MGAMQARLYARTAGLVSLRQPLPPERPLALPSPSSTSTLPAILMVIAAMTIVAFQDATVKYLTQYLPPAQITWARYFFHLLVSLPLALSSVSWRALRPKHLPLQLARGVLLVISSFFFVLGVRFVPLADMLALIMSAPLIVAALSPALLGEPVGRTRVLACLLGFAGALMVIQPGAGTMQWSSLLGLAAGTSFSLYLIITRKLAGSAPPMVTLVYTAVIGTGVTSAALPFVWVTPPWPQALMMVGIGCIAATSHYLLIRAYERAPAVVLAPFNYTELLCATMIGYWWFGDFPNQWTWTGMAVIVTSGLFLSLSERRAKATA